MDNIVAEPQAVVWLAQAPEFGERLAALKAEWDAKAAAAEALEVSDESLQDAKKSRAALRKNFDAIETQRKDALAPVRERIDAFQAVYKECVTDAYTRADSALKEKIEAIENGLKATCETRLRVYWAELCAAHNIDWVPFERTGVKADLASARQKTPKKLMDTLKAFAESVSINLSATTDPEVIAEYKSTLDLGAALRTVEERRRRIEAERVEAERRREAEALAAQAVAKVEAAAPEVLSPPVPVSVPETPQFDATPAPEAVPEPTPVKSPDDVFPTFTFTVYGATRRQLIQIRDFLSNNGIAYK